MKYLILLLLCFQLSIAQTAPVKAQLAALKDKVNTSEKVFVEFNINRVFETFKAPGFNGFEIIGTPSSSQKKSNEDSGVKETGSMFYWLRPLKDGVFTIEGGTFTVNGTEYKTNSQVIEVIPDPDNVIEANGRKVFVLCEVSNSRPYKNQSVMVTYKLMWEPDVMQPTAPRLVFDNNYGQYYMCSLGLPKPTVKREVFKGIVYNSSVLRIDLIRFMEAWETNVNGVLKLETDPVLPQSGTPIPPNTFKSERIHVQPNPPYNDCWGCPVGQFSLKTEVPKAAVAVGKPFQVKLIISGSGFIENKIDMEPIISGFDLFYFVKKEFKQLGQNVVNGVLENTVCFTYTFKASKKGTFSFPKPKLHYFDDKTGKVTNSTADTFTITVR